MLCRAMYVVWAVGLSFALAGTPAGATKEDLSACGLPNGLTVLPERDSPGAVEAGGYIFSFASRRFASSPFDAGGRRRGSVAELFQRMRSEKTGDLMYSSLNAGTLVAVSGRMSDLGSHYLYEFDGKDLPKPAAVWGTKEKSAAGEGTPGAMEGIEEGHCFLLEGVDGKFALVRLVAKQNRAAMVQWAYQPDDSTRFVVPKGVVTAYEERREPAVALPTTGAPIPDELRRAKEYVAQRAAVIEPLRKMVAQDAKTREQVGAKVEAIRLLGQLRAAEAAPDLAAQVVFRDPYVRSTEFIVEKEFPCVGALTAIGKPGSLAALEAIARLGPVPRLEEDPEPQLRLFLLTLVVLRVEGHAVAQFMMERRLEQATPEAQVGLRQGLSQLAKLGD